MSEPPTDPPSFFGALGPFVPPDPPPGESRPPEPPQPPQAAPEAPAPPPQELRRSRSAGESPFTEYLYRRLDLMEHELKQSQLEALDARGQLKQQEELKSQVEAQLKLVSEQVRREKAEATIEQEKAQAHGRVDSLERRLDEMHNTWAQLLREAIGSREGSAEQTTEHLQALRAELGAMAQTLGATAQLGTQLHDLRAQIPAGTQRWEEDARRLESAVLARLTEIERRLADEMERQRDRSAELARERAAIQQGLEDQRRELMSEFAKERLSLLAQFHEESKRFGEALQQVQGVREGESDQARVLTDMIRHVEKMLAEPPHAKDEIVREIEQEKRDLMNALKERSAQFHAFTLERREVERTLGESLLKFQREFDEARAKHVALEARVADLGMQAQMSESRAQLAERDAANKDERFQALAAERDELAKALVLETGRMREQVERSAASEDAWADRLEATARQTAEEKHRRVEVESELADLRARIQSLSDNLARALQERDSVVHESAAWKHEKEQLAAALRKKDEMIGMLSSTFKNLIKK